MNKVQRYKINRNGIEIAIEKKRMKNMYLGVYPPDGHVRISAPIGADDMAIARFIDARMPWIMDKRAQYRDLAPEAEYWYETGEEHYLWGARYALNVLPGARAKVALRGENIDMWVKPGTNRESLLLNLYRRQLKDAIPKLIEKYEPIMGVSVGSFGIRRMRTRWGTCNVITKKIWLNLSLAEKEPIYLEYVVVHEMTHLLEDKHNHAFKAYMDIFLPGWRDVRARLNGR